MEGRRLKKLKGEKQKMRSLKQRVERGEAARLTRLAASASSSQLRSLSANEEAVRGQDCYCVDCWLLAPCQCFFFFLFGSTILLRGSEALAPSSRQSCRRDELRASHVISPRDEHDKERRKEISLTRKAFMARMFDIVCIASVLYKECKMVSGLALVTSRYDRMSPLE